MILTRWKKSSCLIPAFIALMLSAPGIAPFGLQAAPAQAYHRFSPGPVADLAAATGVPPKPTTGPAPTETPTPRPTATPTSTAIPGQSTLLFSDDFDGSSLDTSKWNTCHWWGDGGCTIEPNGELEWYQPENVVVSDGTLKLNAEHKTVKAKNGKTYQYSSGMVSTGRDTWDKTVPPRFAYQYGYAEMRAKLPKGQGLWPTFWMLPANGDDLPEVDIAEVIGRQFGTNFMVLHYRDQDGVHRSISRAWQGPDWAADWHTFALDWTPDALTWYVDGVPRFRYTDRTHIPSQPMTLVANLAVGGRWPGVPDSTTSFPRQMEVDYVKVWSEMPPAAVATATAVAPLLLTPPTPRFSPTPTAAPGHPELLFSDGFDGTSLNTDKWTTCYWWGDGTGCTNSGNKELTWHLPEEVLVSDGTLKLRAQKRTVTDSQGKSYGYTSGMVTTGRGTADDPALDKFAFQYGYAEIRAKVAKGQGLWSSFWLLPADQGWPPEIDVMSVRGSETDQVRMSVYYFAPDGSQGRTVRSWSGPDLSADWHTFGLDWRPDGLDWYVDGVKRASEPNASHVPAQPMYLVIDLAVGGSFPGAPDSTTSFPSYFEVDYVKVWNGRPTG